MRCVVRTSVPKGEGAEGQQREEGAEHGPDSDRERWDTDQAGGSWEQQEGEAGDEGDTDREGNWGKGPAIWPEDAAARE